MKKTRSLQYFLAFAMLILLGGCGRLDEAGTTVEKNAKEAVYIGENTICDYVIVGKNSDAREAGEELQDYIQRTGGGRLSVASKPGKAEHTITLEIDRRLDAEKKITIRAGEVTISAVNKDSLYRAVYLFIDTYLGWIKAGTDEAHISNTSSVIHIPADIVETEPWIEEREAIVTLWNVNWSGGIYLDNAVSVKNNIMYFSEDQLYEYVKMMKYCGFTGIQVTDMCSAWAGLGSWQAVHEKIRMMAEAAHSLDMKFTLWVWGAEFSGYGWADDTVVYRIDGDYAYNSPEVVAVFEKYYDIYADLADCCDRVIGHYSEPGNLQAAEEVAYFAGMLRDKFRAVNPDIDFGINCWRNDFDKNVLISELGNDITLYEQGYRDDPEGRYTLFRTAIRDLGCRLGTWSWGTCEMEIDQLAQMNFNLDFVRSVYQTARNYDAIAKPEYWSEMDSYHVLNAFSLYCAGQLLIDPDTPDETLLRNLSVSVVGEEYAEAFTEMLDIIQDARTGSFHDTFIWSSESYILKSSDYPAEDILLRCEKCIPVLQEMIDSGLESYSMPFPISLNEVLRLMMPHLQQIKGFAEFRIGFAELEAAYEGGAAAETLAERLAKIAEPIKSYNTVVGSWGQVEARAQYEMITDFCERTGMEVPRNAAFRANRKLHIYMQLVTSQMGKKEPQYASSYQWGYAYGEETAELIDELVEEGLFIRREDGSFCLANWENYIYHFN
ncbi:MAG: hypothetical protein NC517_03045 [Firmicutes bacterium]|nr:hypothetical protein [Bacillota bacterium]